MTEIGDCRVRVLWRSGVQGDGIDQVVGDGGGPGIGGREVG